MASKIEKNVEFKIHRYSPKDKRKYVTTHTVPISKGMTLLDVLMYIKDNFDETLAFRSSCRMGICGSCGVVVDGQPMLACYTQILHLNSDSLVIEPLPNMKVIKDLVVDIQPFLDNYNKIKPILIKSEDALKQPGEFSQSTAELKKFWDLSLCTKCSICYSACPAAIDDKFLGPSIYATNYRYAIDSRDEGQEERMKPISDNLWLCTACNSCTMFCPKEVDSSTSIVNERSLLVESGGIPRTVRDVLTSVVRYHNPMGMHPSKRMDWSKDLEVNTFPTVQEADTLCFVGCAPAYDLRSQSIAKSMMSIFNKLNVNFATLGTEEWCCGDHILRMGEKGLFEMLAEHNISTFEKFGFKNILTLSPHCYNTFKNDSPYSEKKFNVQHYTQFLADSIKTGQLKPSKPLNKKVTYHDPCFLGKRNEIYDPPRDILKAIDGVDLVEMKRNKENSFCCGGGAGRTWTEDATPEKRPCVDRVKEALELNVDIIATACPFCVITLEDAVKVLDVEEKIEVRDVVELLEEAM